MSDDPNRLYPRNEISAKYNVSVRTLEILAYKGGGPMMTYIGRKPFYRDGDFRNWLAGRQARSTSDRPKD